jgi:hypothetical protein
VNDETEPSVACVEPLSYMATHVLHPRPHQTCPHQTCGRNYSRPNKIQHYSLHQLSQSIPKRTTQQRPLPHPRSTPHIAPALNTIISLTCVTFTTSQNLPPVATAPDVLLGFGIVAATLALCDNIELMADAAADEAAEAAADEAAGRLGMEDSDMTDSLAEAPCSCARAREERMVRKKSLAESIVK